MFQLVFILLSTINIRILNKINVHINSLLQQPNDTSKVRLIILVKHSDSISLLCVKLKINCKEYCKGCGKQNQRYAVNDIARQVLAT